MNAPAELETTVTTVIPIARGKELKSRIPYPSKPEQTTDISAIRRLAQCLQMAAELLREVSPHQ